MRKYLRVYEQFKEFDRKNKDYFKAEQIEQLEKLKNLADDASPQLANEAEVFMNACVHLLSFIDENLSSEEKKQAQKGRLSQMFFATKEKVKTTLNIFQGEKETLEAVMKIIIKQNSDEYFKIEMLRVLESLKIAFPELKIEQILEMDPMMIFAQVITLPNLPNKLLQQLENACARYQKYNESLRPIETTPVKIRHKKSTMIKLDSLEPPVDFERQQLKELLVYLQDIGVDMKLLEMVTSTYMQATDDKRTSYIQFFQNSLTHEQKDMINQYFFLAQKLYDMSNKKAETPTEKPPSPHHFGNSSD